jgi:hypothetical protein
MQKMCERFVKNALIIITMGQNNAKSVKNGQFISKKYFDNYHYGPNLKKKLKEFFKYTF